MSDGDRLEGKIARMGEDVGVTADGKRVLEAADPDLVLALLVREIDETVLPRCLTVETPDRAVARIDITGGRVLALETADGAVSGRGQFSDMDGFARALGDGLRRFVGAATVLHLRSGHLARRPGPDDLRCPAASIALTPAPADAGVDGLHALAEALSGDAIAWALFGLDGAPIAEAGSEAALDDLVAIDEAALDAALDELDQLPKGPQAPGCLVLGAADGDSLICARAGDALLLMRLPGPAVAQLGPMWQRLFGG